MSGVGHDLLPRPQFSSDNPLWRIPQVQGLHRQYWPRLSARDFLYATTWEMYRRDVHGANCVRRAMERTFWINLKYGRINISKENLTHEKVS